MVDKLIRGKIFEIIVVILFVFISIPVWKSFEEKISAANVTTLDDYNVDFDVYSIDNTDRIIVNNSYYINKNYKIMLVVDKKLDTKNSKMLINSKEYNISDFYYEKEKGKYVYTIVDDYVIASSIYYNIKPELSGENTDYTYIFEEKSVF